MDGPAEPAARTTGRRRKRAPAEVALDTLDPIEIALEEVGARDTRAAHDLIGQQGELIHHQISHLREEEKHLRLKRFDEWMSVTLKLMTIGVGVLVAGLFGFLLVRAVTSHTIVVDAFESPQPLTARGLSGKVVAGALLDTLSTIQGRTRTADGRLDISKSWDNEIRIEVPETGVSVGEIDRLLHDMFGHDKHVGGDLVQRPDGTLSLTVRGADILPKTFEGKETEFRDLAKRAAEYVFGRAEPLRFARYLLQSDRSPEAVDFIADRMPTIPAEQQAVMFNMWGSAYSNLERRPEALVRYGLSVRLDPDYQNGWNNLTGELQAAGDEERAYRVGRLMIQVFDPKQKKLKDPELLKLNFDPLVQDWQDLERADRWDSERNGGAGTLEDADGPFLADAEIRMHDWQGATRDLLASPKDDSITKAVAQELEGMKALDRGDAAAAAASLEQMYAQWRADAGVRYAFGDGPCLLALAYGLDGQSAKAKPIFDRLGRFVSCSSFRADILEHDGRAAEADAAYRAAVARAPSLPFSYHRWGLALARRGDLKGAVARFAAANARGPHWADPLKAWGDVLAGQGQWTAASAKYQAALVYAPHWAELHAAAALAGGRAGA